MKQLNLFDSYTSYGMPANASVNGAGTFAEMKAALGEAGISGAMVIRREGLITSNGAVVGNPLLAADLKAQSGEDFVGIWSLLPSGSLEFLEPQDLPGAMLENRIKALKLAPLTDKYPEALWAVDDYLALAQERGIPLYINRQEGVTDSLLGDLLRDFPKLPVVFCWYSVWSGDRWLRSLARCFPNVYFELSHVHTEGFYKDFITRFGYERLLFASGWPEYYAGGTVLNLLHARIADDAREAVANGNMQRLLKGVNLK